MIFKLLLSVVAGALVGLDREVKGKPTGVRTSAVVCMGTCLFTLLAQMMPSSYIDRGHLVANIPQALGFLCAGAILRQDKNVFGLTSAAILWALGGIGIAIGFGYYELAIVSTILTVLIVTVVDYFQIRKILKLNKKRSK
jgi:putative Mg2+ transporter-C (MgtC) family protein